MLGSAERRMFRLIMKLFSKNSNACDHNSPTLQTETVGQTDRQLTMTIPRFYATLRAVKTK